MNDFNRKTRRNIPLEERFWSKVNKTDKCWVWTGSKRPNGYGAIKINGKVESTHRVAWELTNGPIASGSCVLHKCDNRPCVNPEHLFLGSYSDNTKDAFKKGRAHLPVCHAIGESNPSAKLGLPEVLLIKKRLAQGEPYGSIAYNYHVCKTSIANIAKGKRWAKAIATA